MSYDYFLFARPADGRAPDLDALATELRPIGAPEDLMARIGALFPALIWTAPQDRTDAWMALGGPSEFILAAEADGNVATVKAARVERDEVRALAKALGCVVFDPQQGSFLDG